MSWHDVENEPSEEGLTQGIRGLVESLGFQTELEQNVGPWASADILAKGSQGEVLVIEVKAAASGLGFLPVAAIAQARGTAELVASSGQRAIPLIYTNLPISLASRHAAQAMGVSIVEAQPDRAMIYLKRVLKQHHITVPADLTPS